MICVLYWKGGGKDYREFCINNVAGNIDYLHGKLLNPPPSSEGDRFLPVLAELQIQGLEFFAKELGIYNAVKAKISQIQTERAVIR